MKYNEAHVLQFGINNLQYSLKNDDPSSTWLFYGPLWSFTFTVYNKYRSIKRRVISFNLQLTCSKVNIIIQDDLDDAQEITPVLNYF